MSPAAHRPSGAPRLTLLIPGLLWPSTVLQDTVFDLQLPALQTLLGRSRVSRRSPCDEPTWWSWYLPPVTTEAGRPQTRSPLTRGAGGVSAVGIPETVKTETPPCPSPCQGRGPTATTFPAAALRLLGLGQQPGDATWLCADPVHLRFEQQTMVLEDPAKLDLRPEESAALQASLAPLLAEFGQLHVTTPGQWHLCIDQDAPPCPALLSDLIGQPAKDLLPAGAEYRPWRRLFNEVQMALHEHPVNQARQVSKQPVINSLALWGVGTLPAASAGPAPFSAILSDDAVHHGLAQLWKIEAAPLTQRFSAAPGHRLAVVSHLLVPTRLKDALRYREGLRELEDTWLAPALEALNHGQLKELSLAGLGENACLEIRATGFDKLKFWRRPLPLTELHP